MLAREYLCTVHDEKLREKALWQWLSQAGLCTPLVVALRQQWRGDWTDRFAKVKIFLIVANNAEDVRGNMQIWVDADACPGEIKQLLFRAANRRRIQLTLVANQTVRVPPSPFISTICVGSGMNIADRRIVELVELGDLVITADIPLAADVVAKGGLALNPRGDLYTNANVGARLAARNLFDELRGGGMILGGPSNFTARDRQAFANQLDKWLAKVK